MDGFADLAAALGLVVDMRNGYALLTPQQERSLRLHRASGLDVRIVSYGWPQRALRVLDVDAPS